MKIRTGSKSVIVNTGWTDEARAAALAARRANSPGGFADPNAEKWLAQATDEAHLEEIHGMLKAGLVKGEDGMWHRPDFKPRVQSDKMKRQKAATAIEQAHAKFKVDRSGKLTKSLRKYKGWEK